MQHQGGLRVQVQFSRREDLLRHLEAVLEIPIGSLSEIADHSSSSASRGLSKEAFDALPRVRFERDRVGAEELSHMNVSELKRLMEAFGVSDAGCIERSHLVEKLLERFATPTPADAERLPCISQPGQCAICYGNFRDGEVLRQLGCSELHVFCNGCIQQWLDKNTSCPLCRQECGPPAPIEPPPPSAHAGMPAMMPIGIMASLGGPEHTFLLLDTPLGASRPLSGSAPAARVDAVDPLTGGAGRALSRMASRGAVSPSAGLGRASPAAPAQGSLRPAASRERAPGRAASGVRLPPVQRTNPPTPSAGSERPRAWSTGRTASSGGRSAPPTTPTPPPAGNPRRSSSFLPSIRPLRFGDVASALPRLPSMSRSSHPAPASSPVTGAGRSLSAAGSGRSFAARARAAARQRSSSATREEDCVVL